MSRPPKYYFKMALYEKAHTHNLVPEQVSRLWGLHFGPHVVDGFGWSSDRLAYGKDDLSWIGTTANATKALAGGAKKLIIATSFIRQLSNVFATGKTFHMLAIRITLGPNAPAQRLLNFLDVEILDTKTTANYLSVNFKVHDPTVDVFTGTESSGALDHSKQKAEAARTLRQMEAIENLGKSIENLGKSIK